MPTKEKADAFLKEYGELREKHKLDFYSHPVYVPTDKGTFELRMNVQIVSTEISEPVKSPFVV